MVRLMAKVSPEAAQAQQHTQVLTAYTRQCVIYALIWIVLKHHIVPSDLVIVRNYIAEIPEFYALHLSMSSVLNMEADSLPLQEIENEKEETLRRALDATLEARRAHRDTLVVLLEIFSAPSFAGILQALQRTCEACAEAVEPVAAAETPDGQRAERGLGLCTPRLQGEFGEDWSPCALDANVRGSEGAYRVGKWHLRPGGTERSDYHRDDLILMPMAPGCMTAAALATLRANLTARGVASPGDATAAVNHASSVLAHVAALAERTLNASAELAAQRAAAAADCAALRTALRRERDVAAAAAAAATDCKAEARAVRAELAAAAADAAALKESLEARDATVARLRAQPPAAAVAQLATERAEAARAAADGMARAAEVKLQLAAEKAALLEERCREAEEEVVAAREAAEELTAAAEAKDCRIAELRKALAETQQRAEAEALAFSSNSRDSNVALHAAGAYS
jgi:hypothetical protein